MLNNNNVAWAHRAALWSAPMLAALLSCASPPGNDHGKRPKESMSMGFLVEYAKSEYLESVLGYDWQSLSGKRRLKEDRKIWEQEAILKHQSSRSSQFKLGLSHLMGWMGPRDDAAAERWFRKAAESGHHGAHIYLELMKQPKDWEGPQDGAQVAYWYSLFLGGEIGETLPWGMKFQLMRELEKLAQKGNPDAQYFLGFDYHLKIEKEYALPLAVRLPTKAIWQLITTTLCLLELVPSFLLYVVDVWPNECHFSTKAAKKGGGKIYASNTRTKKKILARARYIRQQNFWAVKAARQGHLGAQFLAGIDHWTSDNRKEAVRWFRQFSSPTKREADAWFRKRVREQYGSLDQWYEWDYWRMFAQNHIGIAYYEGTHGVKRNHAEAARWIRKVATRPHPEKGSIVAQAQHIMGLLYERGHGVPKNKKEARRWFERASEHDSDFGNLSRDHLKTYEKYGGIHEEYGFRWPLDSVHLTSVFGDGRNHKGIDLRARIGTPVYSSMGGKVSYAGWKGNFGKLVIVNHENGFETYYAHLDKILVRKDQRVGKGEQIARSGNTGRSRAPHLHYEIHQHGRVIDPETILRR